jgi:hypothetical protein
VLAYGILGLIAGFLIVAAGSGKVDRRFRTGFKNNEVPDPRIAKTGGLIMLGSLVVAVIGWQLYEPEKVAAPVRVDAAEATIVAADEIVDMARTRRRKRHATTTNSTTEAVDAPREVAAETPTPASAAEPAAPIDPYK